MKKSTTTVAMVVFFVVAAAGCFPGVTGNVDVRARVDTADFAGATASPTSNPAATATAGLSKEDVEDALRRALPTPLPTATPSPTPTLPPGERIREGIWTRPRAAGDPKDGPDRAEGGRLIVRLTGDKRDPLVRRARSSPVDKPWAGVGYLGLVPEEKDWLAVRYDGETGLYWIYGSKIVVIISEEAFLTE